MKESLIVFDFRNVTPKTSIGLRRQKTVLQLPVALFTRTVDSWILVALI